MTIPLWAYHVVLALLITLAVVLLWKINRSDHPWRFADMLVTHKAGKPVADRQAFLLVGGWFVLSGWGSYWVIVERSLPEFFVLTYASYCAMSYGYSRLLKTKEEGKPEEKKDV